MLGKRLAVEIGNQHISYIEYGTGGDITLFLHGWGGSAESFQPLWEQLVMHDQFKNSRFIAIDMPGFGDSPAPTQPWTVEDYLLCVVKYLGSMHITSCNLVVHSMGGRIAIKWLSGEYAAMCKKAVFIAPAAVRHENKSAKSAAGVLKKVFTLPLLRHLFPVVRTLGYKLIGGQDYLAVDGVMKETFKQVVSEDPSPGLQHISTESLIFWGTDDTYVPVSDAETMVEHMKHTRTIIFKGGRHGIHKTHATEIANELSAFL